MPRALSMQRTVVPPGDRTKFLERARGREAYYTAAGCQYWMFEEAALAGAFIEFVEGPDAAALKGAHGAAPEPPLDPARIYIRTELS